ncbi:MAG: flagellar hook-basal body complex protein FliE [Rhizobiaceae bacterium]
MFNPASITGVGGSSHSSSVTAVGGTGATAGQPDFGAMLSDMASNAANTLKTAEVTSIQGIAGEASAHDVASAVMEAEQTLRMAISVRDKVVQAYLEISRMQI